MDGMRLTVLAGAQATALGAAGPLLGEVMGKAVYDCGADYQRK